MQWEAMADRFTMSHRWRDHRECFELGLGSSEGSGPNASAQRVAESMSNHPDVDYTPHWYDIDNPFHFYCGNDIGATRL